MKRLIIFALMIISSAEICAQEIDYSVKYDGLTLEQLYDKYEGQIPEGAWIDPKGDTLHYFGKGIVIVCTKRGAKEYFLDVRPLHKIVKENAWALSNLTIWINHTDKDEVEWSVEVKEPNVNVTYVRGNNYTEWYSSNTRYDNYPTYNVVVVDWVRPYNSIVWVCPPRYYHYYHYHPYSCWRYRPYCGSYHWNHCIYYGSQRYYTPPRNHPSHCYNNNYDRVYNRQRQNNDVYYGHRKSAGPSNGQAGAQTRAAAPVKTTNRQAYNQTQNSAPAQTRATPPVQNSAVRQASSPAVRQSSSQVSRPTSSPAVRQSSGQVSRSTPSPAVRQSSSQVSRPAPQQRVRSSYSAPASRSSYSTPSRSSSTTTARGRR